MTTRWWWACTACAAVTIAGEARAQQTDEATRRRELLDRAFETSRRGDHGSALRLGEEAARIQMSPSLRMFLAEEHEFLASAPDGGEHVVDAVSQAAACVREATAQPQLNNRARILQRCSEVFERLNPRVGRVRVQVGTFVPQGMVVRLERRELPPSSWGEPVPVMPGEVVVEASAREHHPYRGTVSVRAGAVETISFSLQPVARLTAPRPVAAPPPPDPDAGVVRWVGVGLLGLGALSLALGAWQWSETSNQADETLTGLSADGAAWRRFADRVNPTRSALTIDQGCELARAQRVSSPDAAAAARLCDANSTSTALAWGLGVTGLALVGTGAVLAALPRPSRRVTASAAAGPGGFVGAVRITF